MLSLILMKKIASMLFILLLGFIAAKLDILPENTSKVLSAVSMWVVCPCMILNAFQVERSPEIMKAFMTSLVMSMLVMTMFVVVAHLLKKPLKLTKVELGNAAYSNCGNMVIPLVVAMFGNDYVIYTLPFICVSTVFCWSHLYCMFSGGDKPDYKKILTNVNIVSIVVSFLLFLVQFRFPPIIKDSLQSVSDMVGPLAMLITGILLGHQDLKKVFLNGRGYLIASLRLLVLPLISLLLYRVLNAESWCENGEIIMMISFLGGISCCASNCTQMADLYLGEGEYSASICIISTILMVVTAPALIFLFQHI